MLPWLSDGFHACHLGNNRLSESFQLCPSIRQACCLQQKFLWSCTPYNMCIALLHSASHNNCVPISFECTSVNELVAMCIDRTPPAQAAKSGPTWSITTWSGMQQPNAVSYSTSVPDQRCEAAVGCSIDPVPINLCLCYHGDPACLA